MCNINYLVIIITDHVKTITIELDIDNITEELKNKFNN